MRDHHKDIDLFGDHPLPRGGKDAFGHDKLAALIAGHFKEKSSPMSNLAIYGPWGSGKSSVLYLAEKALKDELRENAPLWFTIDAWAHQSDDTLILAMLEQLSDAVKDRKGFRDSVAKIMMASALSAADLFLKVMSVDKMNTEDIVKSLERVEGLEDAFKSKHLVIKHQFQKFINELSVGRNGKGDKKIVIAIDNLDRCKPDAAISVLETLFLVSDLDNCTLVIAVDQYVLISFLNRYYSGTIFNGSRYLEKIFPVSYRIPDPWVCWSFRQAVLSISKEGEQGYEYLPPDQVYTFLAHLLKGTAWEKDRTKTNGDLNDDLFSTFGLTYHYLAAPRVTRNPRRIKRIANFIHSYQPHGKEEAEIILFLVILSDLWPDAFEFLLSANEMTWQNWIDYQATDSEPKPRSGLLLDDQSLRDFISQIRDLHDSDSGKGFSQCAIRKSKSLMNHVAYLRELGL